MISSLVLAYVLLCVYLALGSTDGPPSTTHCVNWLCDQSATNQGSAGITVHKCKFQILLYISIHTLSHKCNYHVIYYTRFNLACRYSYVWPNFLNCRDQSYFQNVVWNCKSWMVTKAKWVTHLDHWSMFDVVTFQGSILRRWKKNWVVLYQDGSLKYFESPDSHTAEDAERMTSCQQILTGTSVN